MHADVSAIAHSREAPLIGQGFLMGLVGTVLCAVANSLFLSAYGAGHLPMVYLGLTVFVPVVSFLYNHLYVRLSRTAIAYYFSGLIFAACVGSWVLQRETEAKWLGFMLLMAWNAYMLVGMLLQGDQVQRLFDVREIKRANPVIMTGSIAGAVLGGLIVGPLIAFMGTTADLLLFCGAVVPVSLSLELYTIRRFPVLRTPATAGKRKSQSNSLSLRQALRNRYIRLVLIYGVCYGLGIRLIGFLFMSAAQGLTTSPDDLSHLLGICLSIGTAGSFLFVVFASARILNRFGLGAALAGSPILIGPVVVAAAVAAMAGSDQQVVLWLIIIAYLLSHTLDSGTTMTALRSCLQALPLSQRTTAETVASGLGKAVANGLAAGLILALQAMHEDGITLILLLIIAITSAWFVISRFIASDYAGMLLESLKKRSLRTATIEMRDTDTVAFLYQCVAGPDEQHREFALDLLRDAHHPSYVPRLLDLATSEDDSIASSALVRIESEKPAEARETLASQMAMQPDRPRRAALIGGYAALHEAEAIPTLTECLDSTNATVREAAYAAMLKHCGIGGAIAVGQRLTAHQRDGDPASRIFAADVMGRVGDPGLYEYLRPLLTDPDRGVQIRALHAAREVRHARLVPALVAHLSDHELRPHALRALTEAGERVLPHLSESLERADCPTHEIVWMLRASAKWGGPGLMRVLRKHMHHPAEDVRQQILKTLVKLGFSAGPDEIADVRATLREEVRVGLRLMEAESIIRPGPAFAPLRRALRFEGFLRRERTSLILAILIEPRLMLRTEEALEHGSAAERAMAIETLDLHLPTDLRGWILPFLNNAEAPQTRYAKIAIHFKDEVERDGRDTLADIITNRAGHWNYTWTRVWAIHAAVSSHLTQPPEGRDDWAPTETALRSCLASADSTIRGIAEWALAVHELHSNTQDIPEVSRNIWWETNNPMMVTLEKLSVLHEVPIFCETPDFALLSVAAIAEEIEVAAGETFMRQGTPADSMYVVVSGKVRIHTAEATIALRGPYSCVGVPALIEGSPRVASGTAEVDSILLRIGKQAFEEVLDEQPEIARATLRMLARLVSQGAGQIRNSPAADK
ncbi:MAG: Npt1/Npt2 family nucleotide transporter [Actinomycetota bacterium]|nr:Npt1/Npt2 family nucleotide transporter [Actinomycetota bacterium]